MLAEAFVVSFCPDGVREFWHRRFLSLSYPPVAYEPTVPYFDCNLSYREHHNFFCNPILFAICTNTFNKLCKDVYNGM
jgi:hypothetical protein